jgi:cholest-4-en-3-one 26-monooxygenase
MAADPVINLLDPDIYQRGGAPHEQFAWLRAHAPVFWHADGGAPDWPGFWAVTRHGDIEQVSRHPEIFSSARRTSNFNEHPESVVARRRLGILDADPPQHTRLRGLVNRGFTPRMIGRLEDRITEICSGLLDDVTRRREADFVADIAAQLPVQVIGELVGAPPEDRQKLYELTNRITSSDDPEVSSPAEYAQAMAEMYAYAGELAEQRKQQPRDDIVTKLLQPDDDKDELTAQEFGIFFILLILGGNETTRNAASGGMLAFFQHPEQWQRLLANPAMIPAAAEEIVRWVSPINHQRRTAMCATELGGQKIAEGDKVVMFFTSANRDEGVFAAPREFDIGRDPNPHLGFGGGGPHFCLGRHLAALELRILLHAIAERMPAITLDGDVSRLRSNFINGIKRMPVRFAPATRGESAG